MKEIVFTKVGMENFGPYIDKMEYDITPNTITLITGPNGVGKTMMLDAIPFTLFGTTSKGMRGDDVVNNTIGKNCHTWVELFVDNQKYVINRYQKYKGKNNVTLETGGEIIHQGHKEVVPLIESMIQPKQLFMNTLMFGQKVKDFFTDLGDAKQKEIFRMVLNLDNYLIYYDNSKKELKEIDEKFTTCTKQKFVFLELIDDIKENLKYLEQKKKDFFEEQEKSLKDCIEKLSQLTRFKTGWEEKIRQLEPSVDQLRHVENEINDLNKQISAIDDKYQSEIDKVENDKNKALQRLYSGYQEKVKEEKGKYEDKIQEMESGIEHLNKQLDQEKGKIQFNEKEHATFATEIQSDLRHLNIDLNGILEAKKIGVGKCPTCKQEIKDLSHLDSEINKTEIKIKEVNKNLEALNLKYKYLIDDLTNGMLSIREQIGDGKRILTEVKSELTDNLKNLETQLNEKIAQVESMAKNYKEKILSEKPKEKNELEEKLSLLLKQRTNHSNEVRELEDAKSNLSKVENEISATTERKNYIEKLEFDPSEIDRQNKRMSEITKGIQDLQDEEIKLERQKKIAEFWKQAFSPSGIPSMLIDESIPFMNETVSKYLEMISNGRYIVSFDTLAETKAGDIRDKISVRVLDTQTKANNRVQFSGGQTRIVDIATILTLGDLQSEVQKVKFNILLFDEIFDSLDDENIGYVSRVLRMLTNKAIMIISHRHVDQLEAEEVYNL